MSAAANARTAPSGVVTLLTDFGVDDVYVGVMKGVLLARDPRLSVVDVSHGVPAQDLDVAAFWLAESYAWFAPGTVHECVVDPGVGGPRAPIVASAARHTFVAPDNGVLSAVLGRDPAAKVRRIDPERLGLAVPSRTFHGRDVFAPVAAQLASGAIELEAVGPAHAPVLRPLPLPRREGDRVVGRVLFADRFGNLVTNVGGALIGSDSDFVEIGGQRLRRVATYGDAAPGECVALVSSFETLELSCRDGSAAQVLGCGPGTPVIVHRSAPAELGP